MAAVYATLQVPGSPIDMLRLALRLGADICVTATKERAKQLAPLARHKARLGKVLAAGLQVVGMLAITFLVVEPTVAVYTVMRHGYMAGPTYLEMITTSVPALMIVLVCMLLRQTPGLALWARLKWAYFLGFGGALTYVVLSMVDGWIAPPMYPLVLHPWGGSTVVYTQGRTWVLAAMVCCVVYIVTVKIRGRLSMPHSI